MATAGTMAAATMVVMVKLSSLCLKVAISFMVSGSHLTFACQTFSQWQR